jgi:transcriptional regulator with XRE-family HTH domain
MMDNAKKLSIGTTVRAERARRGISLDEAAARTGVSKAMLGQIERGESSPTLSTMWKISAGLRIPISAFLAPVGEYRVNSLNALGYSEDADKGIRVYTVFPFDPIARVDYIYIVQQPGNRYESTSHANAKEEYVFVTQGKLTLHVGDAVYELGAGDSFSFAGDERHVYENKGTEEAIYHALVRY